MSGKRVTTDAQGVDEQVPVARGVDREMAGDVEVLDARGVDRM